MAYDEVMGTGMRLATSMEALAVLVAALELAAKGASFDPAVRPQAEAVLAEAGIEDLVSLSPQDARRAGEGLRAFFLQGLELIDHPDRAPGWAFRDPTLLLAQGQASAAMPSIVQRWCLPELEGLGDALERPGAAFLDIGCGVAAMTIAACELWPHLRAVGIDPWPPSMALARDQVRAAGLDERIELREIGIEVLEDVEAFDLVWVPGPFLPAPLLADALDRSHRALRPGGWAILGLYAGPPDPLGDAVGRLRTVRSGGQLLDVDTARTRLAHHGFAEVREIPRAWGAPMRLLAGRRPDRSPSPRSVAASSVGDADGVAANEAGADQ